MGGLEVDRPCHSHLDKVVTVSTPESLEQRHRIDTCSLWSTGDGVAALHAKCVLSSECQQGLKYEHVYRQSCHHEPTRIQVAATWIEQVLFVLRMVITLSMLSRHDEAGGSDRVSKGYVNVLR